ncbi:MAG: hypothetical protein ACJAYU_004387 [Bradymonadia bacterium]|jgi:hypothetical protein
MSRFLPYVTCILLSACGGGSVVGEAPVADSPSPQPEAVEDTLVHARAPEGPIEMTRELLEAFVTEAAVLTDGGDGVLAAVFDDVPMLVISDPTADRMRIISPIIETAELIGRENEIMLEANYHLALDARYATSDGIVYAAFVHPLSSLTEPEVLSAMRQVAALVRNFGSTWSSDELVFGSGGDVQDVSPIY